MSRHLKNQLLARLDPATFTAMVPHLSTAHLEQGQVLGETDETLGKVYFPHGGIVSCVVELLGGGAIETGMVGKDGEFGGGPALDHKVSSNAVVMQVAGDATTISTDRFRHLAQEHPSLRELVIGYEEFFVAQVQQTAACNAVHDTRQRTCKWLLRMHQLVGDDLPLTQEFLAQMMGVRRSSVSEIASNLQKDGLIAYTRGRVHIVDIKKIGHVACECDGAVNQHYERLFPNEPSV
jgi:CRP-like cAMP-binding protein